MPSGLAYDSHLSDCRSTRELLTSLAVFNAWGALLAAIFGSFTHYLDPFIPTVPCLRQIWIEQVMTIYARNYLLAPSANPGHLGPPSP